MEEKVFTFREFQKITYSKNKKLFSKLKKYIFDNNLEDDYEFFKISKDAIIVQNFVGTIPLEDIQIDILPKIPLVEDNIEEEKIRFLEILESIDYFKEKLFNNSKIAIKDTSILEIFIQFFIEEVEDIVKKGLIYRYNNRSENMNIFKGKLDIDNHIKYNFSHKEKFYVKFDEFSVNSLENIFIKMTIQKLKKISVNYKNKERLKKLEHYFENAILWAKIFLNNQSSSIFSTNSGEITSILFPMENIFENYITNKLRNLIQEKYYNQLIIKIQDNSCSIFSNIDFNNAKIDNSILRVKPDIVIKNKTTKEIFILDTKWKVLNKLDEKFKISSEDVYQMLAYVKTYNDRSKNYTCEKAYLI